MSKYNNKGKNLYRCEDCGEQVFLYSFVFSKRSGDRCMGCGGRLEAKSVVAGIKNAERGDNLITPRGGSIQRARELNHRM